MNTLITFIYYILITIITSSCATYKTYHGHQVLDAEIAQIKKNVTTENDIINILGLPSFSSKYGDKTWYYVFDSIEQKSFSNKKKIYRDIFIINFNKTGNIVINFSKTTKFFSGKYTLDPDHTKSEFESNIFYRYINGIGKRIEKK